MEIEVLKSKIHRAVITEANLNYVGSLTLDEDLMDAANLIENEKVQIVNVNNGSRIETYIIKGKRGSGVCCLNGPAARKVPLVTLLLLSPMLPWILKKQRPSNHGSFSQRKGTSCRQIFHC
jgi:L-aspartate-alpha-decarboxylase